MSEIRMRSESDAEYGLRMARQTIDQLETERDALMQTVAARTVDCGVLTLERDAQAEELRSLKLRVQRLVEDDLNGECIMEMRRHLARAGVDACFADEAACVAANQLIALRELAGELLDLATRHRGVAKRTEVLARARALGIGGGT
jgi:hypothetical protein